MYSSYNTALLLYNTCTDYSHEYLVKNKDCTDERKKPLMKIKF